MDFRLLETFCRVADLRSFSRAAEDLLLTQPTVSGHILTLEQSLSLRLFDRTGREARLTTAGKLLYQHAMRILSTRQEALNALSELSQGVQGELSLGASTLPGEVLLPKWIGEHRRAYPRIVVSLRIGDTRDVVENLLRGSVEFGMTGGKLDHSSLHYDLFGHDRIIVIGPPLPEGSRPRRMGFEQMVEEPWIIREEGSGTQMAVEKALVKKGKSLRQFNVAVRMGSASSVKEGVKAGLGLAFSSKKAVEEELKMGLLSCVEIEGLQSIPRPVYVVRHRGRTISPIGEGFLRFLRGKRAELSR